MKQNQTLVGYLVEELSQIRPTGLRYFILGLFLGTAFFLSLSLMILQIYRIVWM